MTNIQDSLQSVSSIFLDSAPVIYFVEKSVNYFPIVEVVFDHIDQGIIEAVTSPVTLAECLVTPLRNIELSLLANFSDLIIHGHNTNFASIDETSARLASDIRAQYNLKLPDAFQVAVALQNGCDTLLTNDITFNRITELNILLINEFLEIHDAS